MRKMKCSKCGGKSVERNGTMPDGVEYKYMGCTKCGEEIVTMGQLHEMAEKYRAMKKYTVKLSKWGESRALRIPKELAESYGLEKVSEVSLIPEKKAIRIVAAK